MAQLIDDKQVAARLKEVFFDKRPKSVRSFALSIGADPSFFSKILNGEKPMTENIAKGVNEKYGVNLEWLWHAVGEKYALNDKEGDLREKYIQVLEENNQLLKKGNKELVDQLREIRTNLDQQSKMLQALAITGKIMKAVTLEALGRIEKRKKDADYSEVWDRKAAEVMGE